MAISDTAALSAVLKQKYTQKRVRELVYKKNRFFSLVPKRTDFGGANKVITIKNANPQGVGVDVSTAQSTKTATSYGRFVVTRTKYYGTASITGEAIRAAKGNENSLVDGLTKEIDGVMLNVTRQLAIQMLRNGGGAIGQISAGSTVSSTTITLANKGDATNFEVGMVLQFSAGDGSSSSDTLRGSGATVTLTAIDVDAGTLTASAAWNTASAAASDYIFRKGDFKSAMKGVLAWTPLTAPTSGDNFFSLDRSSDPTRLAGIRHVGNGGPIEETLVDALTKVVRQGGSPDAILTNPIDWASLVKSQGTKNIVDRSKKVDDITVGYRAVMVDGPEGGVEVIHDLNVLQGYAHVLQLDTWALESLGEAPMILEEDGLMLLRSSNSDDYEVRVGYYGNLTCEAPGWNAVVTL